MLVIIHDEVQKLQITLENSGNGIKETLFLKIFQGSMHPDPPKGSLAFGASRVNSCLSPPKISKRVRL